MSSINTEAERSGPAFAARMLAWYDVRRRILPWREDPAPYHVWLSEIMLQQTRVEAVKAYYERFLAALPDIPALAGAKEDTLLKLWEGLGYYSRVRNLHKGAVMIMEQYDGQMPGTSGELRKIPGIGPYTAAAVASIAFGERIPAVDGNLLRIFARLTAWDKDIRSAAAALAAAACYQAAMEEAKGSKWDRPGDLNQALMDLGAGVCLPNAAPLCGECPLADLCSAHSKGQETAYPVMPAKQARKREELTVFLIHDADRIALRKRPAKGLLAGLYEYPNSPGHLEEKEALSCLRAMGFEPLRLRRLPDARHLFTHREWDMRGYEVLADELAAAHAGDGIFLAGLEEIRREYSIPSAFRAFTKALFPEAKQRKETVEHRRKGGDRP